MTGTEEVDPILGQILAAAILAPSGDNTQPVRFDVSPDRQTIAVRIDPSRDPSPMNLGQRMARLAGGAAAENLFRAARNLNRDIRIEPGEGKILALVHLGGPGEIGGDRFPMPARVTNRRLYDGRPVPADVLAKIGIDNPRSCGATTHWITDRDRLISFADLIGEADAAMFGEATMRAAFLSKIRFDLPPGAEADEGLPLNCLEVGFGDRLALRAMRQTPGWLLRLGGAAKAFAGKARDLALSSSGLVLVAVPDGSAQCDLAGGRSLQRLWLSLAAEGLATQPMMSLLVLENVLDNGNDALKAAIGLARLESIRLRFRDLVPELNGQRPAWLMRFGYAPPPTGRTGRLALGAVVDVASDTS